MIVGIGVDIVDIARFGDRLTATPRLRDRLFTETERSVPVHSLAGRFAVKEAVAKALGAPRGLSWQDVCTGGGGGTPPTVTVSGAVARRLAELGGQRIHVSVSHDGGTAVAMIVIEGP